MTLIEEVGLLLDGTPSVAEIESMDARIRGRRQEVHERWAQITPKNGRTWAGRPGAERHRLLQEGTPADLVRMDEECKLLEAERDQLKNALPRLRQAMQAAERREAIQSLPDDLQILDEMVKFEADALRAYREAQAATDRQVHRIGQLRRKAGPEGTTAKPEQLSKLLEARGLAALPDHDVPMHLRTVAAISEPLGLPNPYLVRDRFT